MRTAYNWIFMVFKAIFVLICAYGLSLHMGPGKWLSFNYYTILSNTVCFVYFLAAIVYNVRRLSKGIRTTAWRPRLEGAVMFCITVTFIIYHFILRPEAFSMGNGGSFYSPANIICHYIVPLMVILDWLLFCPKGTWRAWDPAKWLLIPITYFAYIVLRAQLAGDIGNTGSPYPYGFIDAQALGWSKVMINVGWSALGMGALAYVLYFADLGLAKIGRSVMRK